MSQEKLKVLELLEKGNITAEEAMKLLETLGKEEEPAVEPAKAEEAKEDVKAEAEETSEAADGEEEAESVEGDVEGEAKERTDHSFDYNWIYDLKNNIVESAINISRFVGSQTYNTFGFGRPNQFYSTVVENMDDIKSIKLMGKNDRVEIVGHKEDTIKIEARYKLKRDQDLRIEFENEDGEFKLSYDYNAVHSMGLYVKVPDKQVQTLQVDNKNAEIVIKRVKAGKANFITKNASVELDTMDCLDLHAETRNAPIHVYDVFASTVNLATSNAPISLKSANADFARVTTSNAAINLEGIDIREIYAQSSNAGMIFRNLQPLEKKDYPLYNLEAYTSNGDITVELPKGELPCKINASTSLGFIHTNIDELEYLAESKDFMNAKAKSYDSSDKKISLTLQTSNSNVNIREA